MKLTSVDLTRAGANQKADVCLYKSAAMVDEEQQERKVGKSMIKIDKSRFDADELEMYNALIEKAKVELEEDEEEFEEPVKPTRKREFLNHKKTDEIKEVETEKNMITLKEIASKSIAESKSFKTPQEVFDYLKRTIDYKNVFECPFILKNPENDLYIAADREDVSCLCHIGFKTEYIDTQVYRILNGKMVLVDEIDDN